MQTASVFWRQSGNELENVLKLLFSFPFLTFIELWAVAANIILKRIVYVCMQVCCSHFVLELVVKMYCVFCKTLKRKKKEKNSLSVPATVRPLYNHI